MTASALRQSREDIGIALRELRVTKKGRNEKGEYHQNPNYGRDD
jgi:hypothetical protein